MSLGETITHLPLAYTIAYSPCAPRPTDSVPRGPADGGLSTTGRRYGTTPYHLPLWRISVMLPSACSTLLCSFPLPCGYLP